MVRYLYFRKNTDRRIKSNCTLLILNSFKFNSATMSNQCFTPFKAKVDSSIILEELNNPFDVKTPEICKIAAEELQAFITQNQESWEHNFGIESQKENTPRGKMFGVLVVKTKDKKLGYLSGFSGKLNKKQSHSIFVPSLFDPSTDNYFLDRGMIELSEIGNQIKALVNSAEIKLLKDKRSLKSAKLQQKIFDNYSFLNQQGETKLLCAIFEKTKSKVPSAGAGECAAPKLLQYAFEHEMQPIAIAEFWWGQSLKSGEKRHKSFYPACNDKCRPILGFMLDNQF